MVWYSKLFHAFYRHISCAAVISAHAHWPISLGNTVNLSSTSASILLSRSYICKFLGDKFWRANIFCRILPAFFLLFSNLLVPCVSNISRCHLDFVKFELYQSIYTLCHLIFLRVNFSSVCKVIILFHSWCLCARGHQPLIDCPVNCRRCRALFSYRSAIDCQRDTTKRITL